MAAVGARVPSAKKHLAAVPLEGRGRRAVPGRRGDVEGSPVQLVVRAAVVEVLAQPLADDEA